MRRAAHKMVFGVISGLIPWACAHAANVTLAWDDSTSDPAVAGYRVYYGEQSRTITNYDHVIEAGLTNSASIRDLKVGVTYWFAATTYSILGLESDFSTEVSYTVPNTPPTLDQPADITLFDYAGQQIVTLTGISSGTGNEGQPVTLTAFSSETNLISAPVVSYTSPQTSGTLTFFPIKDSSGVATVTVMADNGAGISNTTIKAFAVTVRTNTPPTLGALPELVLGQNSGPRTVALTGISSGSATESQALSITATSDNQALLPDPAVSYTSPNNTGTITLRPATNALGSATVTVQVSDGQPANATFSQTFRVTVNQIAAAELLTNAVIAPNQLLRFVLNAPITNGHKFNFTVDPTAPAGAKVSIRKGVPYFVWTPTSAQASTTNLILIRATDTTDSTITTNLYSQVIVEDYLGLLAGSTSLEAGQSGALPIALTSSEGVTNLSFTLGWPTNRFSTPSLTMVDSNTASGSVQVQGTNLLVRIQTSAKKVLDGSNAIAIINFRATAGQSSAFIGMPITGITATKPGNLVYENSAGVLGEVVVIGGVPLLKSTIGSTGKRELLLYGRVGTSYEVQSCTSGLSTGTGTWSAVTTYSQITNCQTMTVNSPAPVIFYRLQQR